MKIRISQQLSSQSSTIGDLSYSINEAAQFDLRERVFSKPDLINVAVRFQKFTESSTK